MTNFNNLSLKTTLPLYLEWEKSIQFKHYYGNKKLANFFDRDRSFKIQPGLRAKKIEKHCIRPTDAIFRPKL